jgi:hypothetical protein
VAADNHAECTCNLVSINNRPNLPWDGPLAVPGFNNSSTVLFQGWQLFCCHAAHALTVRLPVSEALYVACRLRISERLWLEYWRQRLLRSIHPHHE